MRRIHALVMIVFFLTSTAAIAGWWFEEAREPGNISRGAREWANNCARCHNLRPPTEYRDDLWKPVVTHMRVIAGLTGQQARDILAFIQASNAPGIPTAPPVVEAAAPTAEAADMRGRGREIYTKSCLACHGADGKGALPGVPELKERLSKPDSLLLKNIIQGYQSPGSPMAMPPKGGNPALTEEDIKAVLSYMRKEFGQ